METHAEQVTIAPVERVAVPLPLHATSEVLAAIDSVGRTEDVIFSSDGSRMVLAGFSTHRVAVLDIAVVDDISAIGCGGRPVMEVEGCTVVECHEVQRPHGVELIDDLLLVTSREAGTIAVPMPPRVLGAATATVNAEFRLDEGWEVGLITPGCVRASPMADGVHEVLVGNNQGHRITRHIVDVRRRQALRNEILLDRGGLQIPDGLALSHDRTVLAVSNHGAHEVLLYAYRPNIELAEEPIASLRGAAYAHGSAFTADDQHLLVADAGSPFVFVYARHHSWVGHHGTPEARVRVMSDEMFESCRHNIQEGGTKGLALHPSGRLVALASEARSVAVFDIHDVLGGSAPATPTAHTEQLLATLRWELARGEMIAGNAQHLRATIADMERRLAEALESADSERGRVASLERRLTVQEKWIRGLQRRLEAAGLEPVDPPPRRQRRSDA